MHDCNASADGLGLPFSPLLFALGPLGQHVHAASRIYVSHAFANQPDRHNTNRMLFPRARHLLLTRGPTRHLRGTNPWHRTKIAFSAGFVFYPSCYPGISTFSSRWHLSPRRCHNARSNQLSSVPSLPPSRPAAAAGGAQLHYHMELRVSRCRYRHYLRLLTRRAPYAHPTEVSTAVLLRSCTITFLLP
jgi:hypothetical protein